MASEERPEGSARSPGMIVTSITVADRPQARGQTLSARLGSISAGCGARMAAGVVAFLAVVTAILVISLPGGHGIGRLYIPHNLPVRSGSPTATRSARSQPLGCLSAGTLLRDPGFASAGFDRGVCAPHHPVEPG